MPRKEYTSLPTNYPVCEHSSCPMAATSLHKTAYSTLMEHGACRISASDQSHTSTTVISHKYYSNLMQVL